MHYTEQKLNQKNSRSGAAIPAVKARRPNSRAPMTLLIILAPILAVTSAYASQVTALPPIESTVFSISSSSLLWYLGGEAPPNYNNQIVLTADGPTAGEFKWTPVLNGDLIKIISQAGNQLAIGSLGPSIDPLDIGINLNYNGNDVGIFKLDIQTVAEKRQTNVNYESAGFGTGYTTTYDYQLFDQFTKPIPHPLDLNEQFGATTDVVPANNWHSAPWALTEVPTRTEDTAPSVFTDFYLRVDKLDVTDPSIILHLDPPAQPPPPPPVNPANLSSQEVFNQVQSYRAGSQTPGLGVLFTRQSLHWYLDHAAPTPLP